MKPFGDALVEFLHFFKKYSGQKNIWFYDHFHVYFIKKLQRTPYFNEGKFSVGESKAKKSLVWVKV